MNEGDLKNMVYVKRASQDKPLITIVTVVYNGVKYLENTILSIVNQTYNNIEYIIIDGASTDGTVDIIKSYGDKISKFVSEPDEGLYDAMNKGVGLADGEYIAFINADDYYVDGELGKVIEELYEKKPDVLYADLDYIDNERRVKRCWRPGRFRAENLSDLWIPPHPTTFMTRELFTSAGGFNLRFRLAADYDLMLRVLSTSKKVHYLDTVLVKMRLGGVSNISWSNIYKQNLEIARSYNSVFYRYPLLQFLLKVFNRLVQMIRAKIGF